MRHAVADRDGQGEHPTRRTKTGSERRPIKRPEDPRLTKARREAFAAVKQRLGDRAIRECMKPLDRERYETDEYYRWVRDFYREEPKRLIAPVLEAIHRDREAERLAAELLEVVAEFERRRQMGMAPPAPLQPPVTLAPPGPYKPWR